jgi:mannose-6-phosphate isomerase
MDYYPLIFQPVLKDYIWGGKKLIDYGRGLPEMDRIAESWEISGHVDGMTRVENGSYAGLTLEQLLTMMGENLVGRKNRWAVEREKFPVLVKLIDAKERLSIQVHPNDAYAAKYEEDELGKTEMWVVLEAEPEAAIIYGLNKFSKRKEIHHAITEGGLENYLNFLPVKKGDHICVPSGTLHAIMEGVVLVEIQQNSNTTYRVYDWNRKDTDGNSRQLHVDKALDVINYDQVNLKLTDPIIVNDELNNACERLCQNQYFTTDRYNFASGEKIIGYCYGDTFEIWGVLSGSVIINGWKMEGVRFSLLPAAMKKYEISIVEDATLLRTYVA